MATFLKKEDGAGNNLTYCVGCSPRPVDRRSPTPISTSGSTMSNGVKMPRFVWVLIAIMVVLGTVNFVLLSTLYKAYTDEYAFFVNQGINFMYVVFGGMVLYPKQLFTDEINEETGYRFPRRKLFLLGFLDSLGTLFTSLGAVHCPGQIQPLLNQTLIPLTIFFSHVFLRARYRTPALIGAFVILLGASVTVIPFLTGESNSSNVAVKWYSIVIYFASNIPMALSAVYKEIAFREVQVNVWYLCQWVSVYQFILTWLYLPLTVLTIFGGDGWDAIFPRFWEGMQCAFGTGDYCPKAFDFPFPADERLGTFWLLIGYCIVNFTFNFLGLLLTKYGSATVRSISYAALLPTTSLAFSLPILGSLQESLTVYSPVSIILVLAGFMLYQRYADVIIADDDEDTEEDYRALGDGAEADEGIAPPARGVRCRQCIFNERVAGFDLVPRIRTASRTLARQRSQSHTPVATVPVPCYNEGKRGGPTRSVWGSWA